MKWFNNGKDYNIGIILKVFQANPFEYNGSAVVAMIGKDCVAIAADRRLGIQAQTLTTDFQKIYPMNDTLYIGFYGLATDAQTV